MGAVVKLPGRAPVVIEEYRPRAATPPQLARAGRKRVLAELLLFRVSQGLSERKACQWLMAMLGAQQLPCVILTAARELARDGEAPSESSIKRWAQEYAAGGMAALVDDHKGRALKPLGCETRMLDLYSKPSQPKAATVAYWLDKEGHPGITAEKVRRRLKRAPSNIAETSSRRLGQHHTDQNKKPYQLLDWSNLPVGALYVGDGHRCDVYVEHPSTGEPVRPELTVWMDRRSQYIVGAWMAYDENSRDSVWSLSEAIYTHRNVPGCVYVDPGAGFTADLMMHPETGFLSRFNIEPIVTRPGNARAKGIIEGFFGRHYEERYGKLFDQAYCGHCRTDDDLSRLRDKLKRGEKRLPSWAAYRDGALQFMHEYGRDHNKALGCTPASLWDQRESVDPILPRELMERPRDKAKVRHGYIQHDNRVYRPVDGHHSSLNDRWVLIEWNWRDDGVLWIYELETGAYLCEAVLQKRRHGMTESRLDDIQNRRMQGRIQRKERDIERIRAESRTPITADQTLAGLEHMGAVASLPENEIEGLPPLDLYDTDY